MNNDFELLNMPNDVYVNADGDNSSTTPVIVPANPTTTCGRKPLFKGKHRDAYDACLTKEQVAAQAAADAKAADLAATKALAESAAAQVKSLQADADIKQADSAKALADATTAKNAADDAAKKKAQLAESLKAKSAEAQVASERLASDRDAIATGQDSDTNWFVWGVVGIALIVGVTMYVKHRPKVLAA